MFEIFYKPQENISYDFILLSYLLCTSLFLMLLLLDLGLKVEAVKGFWIIFAPFVPCLLWAYYMRQASKKNKSKSSKQAKMKKDD